MINRLVQFIKLPYYLILLLATGYVSLATAETGPQLSSAAFKSFTAEYALRKKGMTIARIRYQLSVDQSELEFTTYAKPKGLASLISRKPITERSLIAVTKTGIKPTSYSRRFKGDPDAKIQDMQIDYESDPDKALVKLGDKNYEFTKNGGLWDELSLLIAIMHDLKQGKTDLHYRLIDDDELKEHRYSVKKTETLKTAAGEQQAIKVIRVHGKRETYMWFAPDLNFLLLKVQRYREDKLKSELLLDSVTGELLSR